jgi:two-component system, cell cycle sensor histidine kinase and response regulator CckA
LFEAMPLPSFVWDCASGQYLAVSEAAVRKYGWSRDEFLRMTIFDVASPAEGEYLRRAIASTEPDNQVPRVWTHYTHHGETFEAEITTHPVEFAGRKACLSVVNDVTERQRLEARLRHSQKMHATGLLAGGVAHDFNNLLGVIVGAAELARHSAPSAKSQEYLNEIGEAAKRAAMLTRKLLAFSRKQEVRVRSLDLGEAIDDFLQLARRVIGEDIELVVRKTARSLVIDGDAPQLEQIFLTLFTNARQAMPGGGRIVLELGRTTIDAGYAAREPWAIAGDYAELRVAATGAGVAPLKRAHLLEADSDAARAGAGLGMEIVRGIVRHHRGLLRVEESGADETTVRLLLPLADAPEVEPEQEPAKGAPIGGGSETILIAEDEPALRRLLASSLTELGYEVVIAKDGEEAANAFEAAGGRVALAILDVVMPRLGGPQAYARMRAIAPGLKVVFTTGYAPETSHLGDVFGDGTFATLAKPFSLGELGQKVREMLDATDGPARATPIGLGA